MFTPGRLRRPASLRPGRPRGPPPPQRELFPTPFHARQNPGSLGVVSPQRAPRAATPARDGSATRPAGGCAARRIVKDPGVTAALLVSRGRAEFETENQANNPTAWHRHWVLVRQAPGRDHENAKERKRETRAESGWCAGDWESIAARVGGSYGDVGRRGGTGRWVRRWVTFREMLFEQSFPFAEFRGPRRRGHLRRPGSSGASEPIIQRAVTTNLAEKRPGRSTTRWRLFISDAPGGAALRWSAGAFTVQTGASIIGTPRGPRAAANRLRLGDLGARISALREGRYEAAACLDNEVGLPNE